VRRTASGVLSALAVLALGFVVALAASSVPGRAGDEPILDLTWQPGVAVESILTWLIVIAAVIGALIMVFATKQGSPPQERKRNRLVALVVGVLVFAAIARFVRSIADTLAPETSEVVGDVVETTPIGQVADNSIWMLGLLIAAVVAIALAKVGLAIRSDAPPVAEASQVESVAPVAVGSIASMAYGDDPRGRVFGAYAAFEKALEEVGVPRSPSETAARHVGRATSVLELSALDVGVLSGRHSGARFGPLEPTLDEASEAESASERLRGEIQQ
jgi:multisubunit Na+/H+ antiporter MnhB subunit